MKRKLRAWYIKQARKFYGSTNEIEVDPNAKVSGSEDGAWVQAWVWVDAPEEENENTGN